MRRWASVGGLKEESRTWRVLVACSCGGVEGIVVTTWNEIDEEVKDSNCDRKSGRRVDEGTWVLEAILDCIISTVERKAMTGVLIWKAEYSGDLGYR